ncbi:MAG: hypothetical protein EZS28_009327 [Streblomastix strix]|uniref:Uncharacterized protein n=1 Tax=Streblomastix strix TaxID=222440 RepID=A0A5J4WKK3_9EUKA|nr:MAG: hypothetical protein EZS28_009327 [Streblomastix strix]
MSENGWDLLDPVGDEALDLGQDRSMESNWRGQMGHGGSQSNVERWRCEGDVGSFVWMAKRIKENNRGREVLGRVEGGDQRGDCAGGEH